MFIWFGFALHGGYALKVNGLSSASLRGIAGLEGDDRGFWEGVQVLLQKAALGSFEGYRDSFACLGDVLGGLGFLLEHGDVALLASPA